MLEEVDLGVECACAAGPLDAAGQISRPPARSRLRRRAALDRSEVGSYTPGGVIRKSIACLAVVLGLQLAPALAQSKLDAPPLEQYLRWGPLRVRPGIELSDVGYDDNILANDLNMVSDYGATVSPKLQGLLLLGDQAFLELTQRFDFRFWLENTDQNFTNTLSSARLIYPHRRMGFFADLLFERSNLRPTDLQQVLVERKEKRVGGGVIFTPSWRTEIELGQYFSELDYDEENIAFRQDRDERTTRLDTSYRVFGRSRILFDALYRKIDFRNPFVVEDLVIPRDTVEQQLLGGLAFGEGGRLTGAFRVGWGTIDAEDELLEDLSELIGDLELVLRAGSRTKLQLTGRRLPGFAVFGANAYYLETTVGLRAVRYLSRLWGVEAGGSVGRLTFPASINLLGREDDITRWEVGARLRLAENAIGRKVEYSIRVGRYRRDSTVDFQNLSRNTVGFDAVVGF